MLKLLTCLCLVIWVASAAQIEGKPADMEFVTKQKKMYELMMYVNQDALTDMEYYEIGKDYSIENNMDKYNNQELVQRFLYYYRYNMLRKDAIYTPLSEEHVQEASMLFDVFYAAQDFQTFYKTACWARIHLNNGVFMNALTVAVFYRPDCKYIRLPPVYEIYPNLFFDANVIQEAHRIKMTRGLKIDSERDNVDTYIIYANYSGNYAKRYDDFEYKLDYFFEDTSLNSFYFYFRNIMPSWLSLKEQKFPAQIRGALYLYIHQQLLARYILERYSNDLPKLEDFSWYSSVDPGFYANLMLQNGMIMPLRGPYSEFQCEQNSYTQEYMDAAKLLYYRINDAIDSGFMLDKEGKLVNIYTEDGYNMLGNVIEGNTESLNYRFYGSYEYLLRNLFAFNPTPEDKNTYTPAPLQYYSTSVRDPQFFRLYNSIINCVDTYKSNLEQYSEKDVEAKGLKFESVEIDKLQTYFDQCETLLNNAIYINNFKEGRSLKIKARRTCLNNKPFNYALTVTSDKPQDVIIKIFIAPIFDDAEPDIKYLEKYYNYFFQLDCFEAKLEAGTKKIIRKSTESTVTMPEMTSMDLFYKKLQRAISGSEPLMYYEKIFGFPERLTLPKGKPEGMKFKMFFYMRPIEQSEKMKYELPMFGKVYTGGLPFGFPLDRPAGFYEIYNNMFFKDVMIYHTREKNF